MKISSAVTATILALAVALVVLPDFAFAGTGGTEFNSVWTKLTAWSQGTLGRIIAGGMVLVGMIAGIARQSLMGLGVGLGAGLGLYNMPTILKSVVGATLPAPDQVASMAQVLHQVMP